MSYFVDVILPLPLKRLFTYSVTEEEYQVIEAGMRVSVPFGKRKTYTGLVFKKHLLAPQAYQAKSIKYLLDTRVLISPIQFKFWSWLSEYYLTSLGEVYLGALPALFRLESDQFVSWVGSEQEDIDGLNDKEYLIYEALQTASSLSLSKIEEVLNQKKVYAIVQTLADKALIRIEEKIFDPYKDKLIAYVRLSDEYATEESKRNLFELVSRSEKQRIALMTYFSLRGTHGDLIKIKELEKSSGVSMAVIKGLIKKEILIREDLKEYRVSFGSKSQDLGQLSLAQQEAKNAIITEFNSHFTCLFKGVTGSGKTHVYASMIRDTISKGKQVLLMLPEIGLTTQIISRLSNYFGEDILVYHSKYNAQERAEVWHQLQDNPNRGRLVVGTRSTLFLPFSNLDLIIVDEEHETSYKQQNPAPRFQARDSAVVLAQMHCAKVLLGSATPSLESSYNVVQGKYGFVDLKQRFNRIMEPEISLIDIKEKNRKKRMTGNFSDTLIQEISTVLESGRQVILFQNRRGYAPIMECNTCGHTPQCPNCDVSLTYHKYADELRCHYCYYKEKVQKQCGACGSSELDVKGFGTEQVAKEVSQLFPTKIVARMDLDATRRKNAFEELIADFERGAIDILVGTQMLTKGLDFDHVGLVGVMQADRLLNFPDFRAHENSYQLLTQVAGRSGRAIERGKVLIQTYNPYHQILQQVSRYDYKEMYTEQLEERYQFKYPPFYKLIKFTFKHKDQNKVQSGANWYADSLRSAFGEMVLGPSIPAVGRVKNLYIRHLILKIPKTNSLKATKKHLQKVNNHFEGIADFRSIRFTCDVDPY